MAPYLSLEQCNIHNIELATQQTELLEAFHKITNISKEEYNEERRSYYVLLLGNYPRVWRQLKLYQKSNKTLVETVFLCLRLVEFDMIISNHKYFLSQFMFFVCLPSLVVTSDIELHHCAQWLSYVVIGSGAN